MLDGLMEALSWALAFFFFVWIPILLTYVNIRCLSKKRVSKKRYDVLTLVLGPVYSVMYLFVFVSDNKEYYEPVILGEIMSTGRHTPIAGEYELSFQIFAVVGIIAMFILCIWKKRLPPLVSVILLSAVYLGNTVNIVFLIQLKMNIVMCIYPLNFLFMTVRVLRDEVKKQT